VTVVLDFDKRPFETGFIIQNDDGDVVHKVDPGTYQPGETRQSESITLIEGMVYSILFMDSAGDGFCCDNGLGRYTVLLGSPGSQQRLLLSGTGDFKHFSRHKFVASTSGLVETSLQGTPRGGTFPISISINTGSEPEQISWTLTRIDLPTTQIYATVPIGTYNASQENVVQTLHVEEHGLYSFLLAGTPSCCRSFEIQLGETWQPSGGDRAVFGWWNKSAPAQEVHTFIAQHPHETSIVDPGEPALLSLVLQFDEYPQEISWFVIGSSLVDSIDDDRIVAFGPRQNYDPAVLASSEIQEEISLPAIAPGESRRYTVVLLDSAGDGLCCEYGDGSATLYFGPVERRNRLGRTRFRSTDRYTKSFSIHGDTSSSASLCISTIPWLVVGMISLLLWQ